VLIGKGGRVEAVHVGFDATESSEILAKEIESLLAGRKLFQAEEIEQPVEAPAAEVQEDKPVPDEPEAGDAKLGGQRD
jgi:hypothetical protein